MNRRISVGVAVSDEQIELAKVIRSFLAKHDSRKAARAALDGATPVPEFWTEMADLGWFGLHVPESLGGGGFGVVELAVVAEELGRECTPGPFLSTVVCAGALAAAQIDGKGRELLAGLISGRRIAGLGLGGALRLDGDRRLSGNAGVVVCSEVADVLALTVGDDLVFVPRDAGGVAMTARRNLDPTRPCARVTCDNVDATGLQVLQGGAPVARALFQVLAAAEAAGGTAACREMATDYAKTRVAFGQPIGQFQAVKHHCANMLIDEEMASGLAWLAARSHHIGDDRSLVTEAARAQGLASFLNAAKLNVQVHGGIGFTWEHDVHLYLRRANALAAIAGPVDEVYSTVARRTTDPTEHLDVELPAEAQRIRAEVRRFVAAYQAESEEGRHRLLVEHGYLYPHWPKPWGRGAGPVEQLVIDQELKSIDRNAGLGPTWWSLPIVLPTVIAHGTPRQQERWILPTMHGDLKWCQLFSEPGAGSDLASLSTRARRTEGGWIVTGQKVWTSNARDAALGLALVRTDADAPKHRGITCVVIDMSAPGVVVQPLREITGHAQFNEVFLDDVFVRDDDVVGEVNAGWRIARTTLENERVMISGGSSAAGSLWSELDGRSSTELWESPAWLVELGQLRAADMALRALNLRGAVRSVAGATPGVEGSLTKLIAAEAAQRFTEFRLRLAGQDGVFHDDDPDDPAGQFLLMRQMTIMGGTSEIMRNVIAERILGLPRDVATR